MAALISVANLAGGIWLVALGGSGYYVAIGIGLIATGLLLATRRAAAFPIYTALPLATLGWAVVEVGFD